MGRRRIDRNPPPAARQTRDVTQPTAVRISEAEVTYRATTSAGGNGGVTYPFGIRKLATLQLRKRPFSPWRAHCAACGARQAKKNDLTENEIE
jgi:hypothetical protein